MSRSIRSVLAAALAASALPILVACGVEEVETADCGVVVDASSSAGDLMRKSGPVIESFVANSVCGKVRLVAVSANSIGDTCTAPVLDLARDMRTHPADADAWLEEFREEQAPQIAALGTKLVACVDQRGTSGGTDVYGALTELARTLPDSAGSVRVLLISDLINTVDTDLRTEDLTSSDARARVAQAAVDRGRLPEMAGWEITSAGASFGTIDVPPAVSADIQTYWREAFEARGASYEEVRA